MAKKTNEALPSGYETTIITKVDMTDEALSKFREKITAIIKQFGGEVILTEDWGRRKLAYNIKKEQRGLYSHFVFSGRPGVVAELERNLRIHEKVIRFLTVLEQQEFDKPSFLKKHFQFSKNRERREEDFRIRDREFGREFSGGRGDYGDKDYGDRGDRDYRGGRNRD